MTQNKKREVKRFLVFVLLLVFMPLFWFGDIFENRFHPIEDYKDLWEYYKSGQDFSFNGY